MIECPICRVENEDLARFCAECGQRLTPKPEPEAPGVSVAGGGAAPAELETKSGLAGTVNQAAGSALGSQPGQVGAQTDLEDRQGDRNRVRQAATRSPAQDISQSSAGRKRQKPTLRSPLLAGYEEGPEGQEWELPASGETFMAGSTFPHRSGSSTRGKTSADNLLPNKAKGELPKRAQTLHSPLLQGREPDEYFLDDALGENDDPDSLRSPLLAARFHPHPGQSAKPAAGKTDASQPPGLISPGSAAAANEQQGQPEQHSAPGQTGPGAAPLDLSGQWPPPGNQPGTPRPPAPAGGQPAWQAGIPGEPYIQSTPTGKGSGTAAHESDFPDMTRYRREQASTAHPAENRSSPAGEPDRTAGDWQAAPAALPSPQPTAGQTASAGPLAASAAKQAPDHSSAQPPISKTRRTGKAAKKTDDESAPKPSLRSLEHYTESSTTSDSGQPGAMFLGILLIPVALLRGYTALLWLQTPNQPFFPVVADQLGQLVAIVCLMVICFMIGSNHRS